MTIPSRLRCFRRLVFRLSTLRRIALAPSLSRSLPDRLNREPNVSGASSVVATVEQRCGASLSKSRERFFSGF